ncbi:ATP-binding cassette domain-containing protein [Ideonella sp. B7]|uniref:ABC transporter ATP-binding protein n=1 Tax=Ideonella benzenivorans TaxID=2831643 RepID=UPI001CEDD3E4|nr:ATP-binding cassette domain-containing protein [Ideonella benzenivorans]MCA6215564.1 ATP-binding cassette domain-containing protein [Ideonella benzenivorans]
MNVLEIDGVSASRGGSQVVRQVSFAIPDRSITVLLGPNGAGKSTLLDGIAGVLALDEGTVRLEGDSLQGLKARQRFQRGVAYVEQGRTVFPRLSVRKNIEAAAPSAQAAARGLAQTLEIFPELEKRLEVPAGMLSGGEQQMIVLGRALINQPRLLLIDELSLGLAPLVVQRFMPLLTRLKAQSVAVLLVEQYAQAALAIGDDAVVLAHGEVVLRERCERLREDPALLQRAYLG